MPQHSGHRRTPNLWADTSAVRCEAGRAGVFADAGVGEPALPRPGRGANQEPTS